MIEQLRFAGDQLRAAWGQYIQAYSGIQNYYTQEPHSYFPPALTRQLDTELAFISSYEPKIEELRLAINRARNYASKKAPINTLPPEILIRIFHLARERPCKLDQLGTSKYTTSDYSNYPDYIAHVCTLWRAVALSTSSLWCHIDLTAYEACCNGFLSRAWSHLGRTAELPLQLHISEHRWRASRWSHREYKHLYDFIRQISSRVESFELVPSGFFRGYHSSVFRKLLSNERSILTKLIIRSESSHSNARVLAVHFDPDSDRASNDLWVGLEEDQLEDGLAPLTVLHLRGIFPLWSSRAYHGLVDLRLLSTKRWSYVQEAQFATILRSSTGLRILHFGLAIQDSALDTEKVSPVHLEYLQVVKIFPHSDNRTELCPGRVLRLLVPGSKPLRLSFEGYYALNDILTTELEQFLGRSSIERFYTKSVYPPMTVLLRHSASLERVVLDNIQSYHLRPEWLQVGEIGSLSRLRSLHITRSFLSEGILASLVDCCPNTVLHSCEVNRINNERLSISELSNVFPTIRTTEHALYPLEDPTADWDVID